MFKTKLKILMKGAKNTYEATNVLSLVENCSKYIKSKADIEVRSVFLDALYGEANVSSKQYMDFLGSNEKDLQESMFSIMIAMKRLNNQSMDLIGEEIFPNFNNCTILEMYIKNISDEFCSSES